MTPDAAELQEMQALNYDAITFGNHEFDWTPSGLFLILTAAWHARRQPPDRRLQHEAGSGAGRQLSPPQVQAMTVPKLVKTLPNGLKVGIFGLLGKNAAQVAPTAAPFTFDPIATTAAAMVVRAAQPGPGRPGHRALALRDQPGRPGRGRRPGRQRARHRRDPERPHPRRAHDRGHRRQDGDHPDRPLRRAPGQAGAHGHARGRRHDGGARLVRPAGRRRQHRAATRRRRRASISTRPTSTPRSRRSLTARRSRRPASTC